MKKRMIRSALVVLAVIACTLFISDGLTYLISSLMALAIVAAVNRKSLAGMKIIRWAKANPKKAQVLITALQVTLMALAIFSGYNLKEAGYRFSNTTAFLFSTIMVIGFLSVPFLPKRNAIAIPKVLQRHRLAYIAITLSSFVIMAVFGNRLTDDYPGSPITQAVKAIDQAIFPENDINMEANDMVLEEGYNNNNDEQALADESSNKAVFAVFTIPGKEMITPSTLSKKEAREKLKEEKKAKRLEKKKVKLMKRLAEKRLAFATAAGGGAVLLIILLVLTTCAGFCLLVGGTIALIDGAAWGILGILAGGLIGWLSIRGISRASKRNKEKPKKEPAQ